MKRLILLLWVGLWANPSLAVVGASSSGMYCHDTNFLMRETLSVPGTTRMMVSVMTPTSQTLRVDYSSDRSDFFDGTYSSTTTQVANNNAPAHFNITGLTAGTRYYYRVVCHAGLDYETFRPINDFETLHTDLTATLKIAMTGDDHLVSQISRNNCFADDPTDLGARIWNKTRENLNIRRADYDFLVTLGDTWMNHCQACDNSCFVGAGSGQLLATGTGHSSNNSEGRARTRLYIRENPIFKYLPWIAILGNHDGEPQGWSVGGHSSTTSTAGRTARLEHLPEPADTYTRIGDADDLYYSFESGDALFIVLDAYRYSAEGDANGPQDPDDWIMGTDQRSWFTTLVNGTAKKFVFVFVHQTFGGTNSQGNDATWYARGDTGATTDQAGRTGGVCVGGSRDGLFCDVMSNYQTDPGDGNYCPDPFNQAYCTKGFAGTFTNDFDGAEQQYIQDLLEAAAVRNTGESFFIKGHDHVFAMVEKFDGSGATQVHYITVGRPGFNTRNGWLNRDGIATHYNYRENVLPHPVPVGATNSSYDRTDNCWDGGNGCGSMERGHVELTVYKGESVEFRYVLADPDDSSRNNTYLDHMLYPVDPQPDITTKARCKGDWMVDQTSGTTLDDECPSASAPDQAGSNTATLDLGAGCVWSTNVPGTHTTSPDPRRSCDVNGDSSHDIADAGDEFEGSGGFTISTWFAADTLASQNRQTFATKGALNEEWTFQYAKDDGSFLLKMGGASQEVQVPTVVLPDGSWNHLAATYSGDATGMVSLYLNGVKMVCRVNSISYADGNCPVPVPTSAAGADVELLGYDVNVRRVFGDVHELVYQNRELAPEEVCRVARCGLDNMIEDRGFSCDLPPGQICEVAPQTPYNAI